GQQVDITLYDTFAVPQTDSDAFDAVVADPLAGRVIIYGWDTPLELVSASQQKGAAGYVPKTLSGEELVSALERVHAGEYVFITAHDSTKRGGEPVGGAAAGTHSWPGREEGLSAREAEMLALISQGLSNADIATRCYLSANTVKTYIRGAYRKVGVDTRSLAVIWGMAHGMGQDRVRVTSQGTEK
ncbi:MAG: response regulator transcription factor, partial [Ornithinimicrobium sp.]